MFQFVGVKYGAMDCEQRITEYDDAGVVQVMPDSEGVLRVVGAQIPGFEF